MWGSTRNHDWNNFQQKWCWLNENGAQRHRMSSCTSQQDSPCPTQIRTRLLESIRAQMPAAVRACIVMFQPGVNTIFVEHMLTRETAQALYIKKVGGGTDHQSTFTCGLFAVPPSDCTFLHLLHCSAYLILLIIADADGAGRQVLFILSPLCILNLWVSHNNCHHQLGVCRVWRVCCWICGVWYMMSKSPSVRDDC